MSVWYNQTMRGRKTPLNNNHRPANGVAIGSAPMVTLGPSGVSLSHDLLKIREIGLASGIKHLNFSIYYNKLDKSCWIAGAGLDFTNLTDKIEVLDIVKSFHACGHNDHQHLAQDSNWVRVI